MRRVILESPFKAPTHEGVERNKRYARACVHDCILRGDSPYASHLLLTQDGILDDNKPEERKLGIQAGLEWQSAADAIVVYTDRGISDGMRLAIARAEKLNLKIEYRSLANENH